jgi:hypothetical protein
MIETQSCPICLREFLILKGRQMDKTKTNREIGKHLIEVHGDLRRAKDFLKTKNGVGADQ